MLDYRIHTFLTLYREMNYRRTAELLNMTQPGVTQHIHFLEKAYSTRLFRYDGKTLSRTRAADLLKQSVERIMAEETALQKALAPSADLFLRVGATKTIGEFVILPTAARFAAPPDHRLELVIDNTEALLAMLDERLLDFALVEGAFDKARFEHHLFKKEHFVGVCEKRHPFTGRRVSFGELFSQTLIVREQGSGTRDIMEQLLKERGYSAASFKRVITVNSFAAIRHFVAQGLGITFAYRPIVDADCRLAAFDLEDVTVVREFNYVYHNRNIARQQIRQFEQGAGAVNPSDS